MKRIYILFLVAFPFQMFAATTGDETEMRKCITGYHIKSRTSDNSLKNNQCKLVVTYYDGQMNKIYTKTEVAYNKREVKFPASKNNTHMLTVTPGKYKLVFKADTYYDIISDTLEFAPREKLEIQVNMDSKTQPIECDKPVIYIYSPNEMPVEIKLSFTGENLFTYPIAKNNTWNFTASPNGEITVNEKKYNYLFWEGTTSIHETDIPTTGFEVRSDTLITFFENLLTHMGLTTSEQQDFITYWVPRMNKHSLNEIHFLFTNEFSAYAPLSITPTPDEVFRVFMVWKPIDAVSEIPLVAPIIPACKRKRFTVLEWGGSELKVSSLSH